ncbi:MAG: sensor histidine kinase [Gorillibacterium sp.]|nr:sensor histidine kinase [Gorillibacterium sp.]
MAYLRKLSIRSQLFILAGAAIFVILAIILHTYSMMSGMITRSHEEYVKQTVTEMKKNVTSNMDVISRLMQNISYSVDVQSYLVEKDELPRYELFKKNSRFLTSQREAKDGILDIVISGNNDVGIDINGGNRYLSPMKKLVPDKSNAYYVGMQQFGTLYGSGTVLILASSIGYVQPGELFNTNIGTIFFIIDPKALVGDTEYDLKKTNTQIYLLDRDYKVITSNSSTKMGSILPYLPLDSPISNNQMVKWQDKLYVMQSESLADIDGSILSVAPKDELLANLLDIRRQELFILAIGLLVLGIPFMFIINNILRPLKKMIFFMTSVKQGENLEYRKRISLKGYMEISIMAFEFNSMLDEIEQLTRRLIETNTRLYGTELEKKKSELAFLRSQINPHFLYNTLEAITGMAAVEGQSKIKTMTRSLSSIFRYSIKGGDVVPLREEIKMVESFIQIQQIRFVDRFSVQYNFTEDALDFIIPKMILQPLVENAIYHGLEPNLSSGLLRLQGSVNEQGQLNLLLEDNGVGIAPNRLEQIRGMLAEPLSGFMQGGGEQSSIGLVNVNNRIQIMFGNDCGMQIESILGKGTQVRLIIGMRRSEPDA